jgi:hypothetical protein
MESEKKSMKKATGKRGGGDRKDKKTDVGYLRVIAIKKEKESISNLTKKYETIPSSSGSSSILHIFSGEKKEVSNMKLSSSLSGL